MELINKIQFFDTEKKEFILSVSFYQDGYWYKILTECGDNITGKCRLDKTAALEYYANEIKGIRESLIESKIIFTCHES